MGKIVILDELTANQIAAGEVVERPASVVKELVENSIDAGASIITVEIKNGGISMIKVIDNGCGIDNDDVEIAFERHATSKIRGPQDLESIYTFGFRGEALASIASVSNIELLTKTENMENGILISLSGGKVTGVSPAGTPKGTNITINNLFFNTPARFKFLKKDSTEASNVADVVAKAALGNPDIAFKFINNRIVNMHTPGNGDLLSAIFSVYGKETAKGLLPLSFESGGVKLTGFAGSAEAARATRSTQTIFINKRYIKSKIITAAIDEAYKTVLMKNKHPFILLNLEINPHLVDVNVHPQKLEVRFSDEQLIFRSVYSAVNNALMNKNFNLGEHDKNNKDNKSNEIFILNKVKDGDNTFIQEEIKSDRVFENKVRQYSLSNVVEEKVQQDKSSYEVKDIENNKIIESKLTEGKRPFEAKVLEVKNIEAKNIEVENIEAENIEAKNTETVNKYKIFKEGYSIIGQLFKTYIIIEQDNEILFIDQHAAHERIMFEELKGKFYNNEELAQMLISPITIELTVKESIFIRDNKNIFEKMGFLIDEFGHNSFLLRSVTFGVNEGIEPKVLFVDLLDYMINNMTNEKLKVVMDETLYMIACKSAVKANKILSQNEIKFLIEKLETMENPRTCPHGRPTLLKFSKYDMEKLFKRVL
jgi:DNA mismatch repair protein MutL